MGPIIETIRYVSPDITVLQKRKPKSDHTSIYRNRTEKPVKP